MAENEIILNPRNTKVLRKIEPSNGLNNLDIYYSILVRKAYTSRMNALASQIRTPYAAPS